MTLSPKIEAKIRSEVERFLTKLQHMENVTDVRFSSDGPNALIIRAVIPPKIKRVELIQAEIESFQRTAVEYVTAKGAKNLAMVYSQKVANDVKAYADDGVRVAQVILKGDKHPFRVTYMVRDEL
ncbi:hypothetical protein pEaSNUABM11_00030 [Erwinia phage pEa_SNUABM_11]|nr:hypothetical protein pEaSNUABM11_00030 [Erwinia phage pEa_SNUABM_11]